MEDKEGVAKKKRNYIQLVLRISDVPSVRATRMMHNDDSPHSREPGKRKKKRRRRQPCNYVPPYAGVNAICSRDWLVCSWPRWRMH